MSAIPTLIKGKRIRVTELDACGAILPTSKTVVTDGFVSVTITPETEDGQEITLRNADGKLVVNERLNPTFKNFGIELELTNVLPDLISFMSNSDPYRDGSDTIGVTVAEGEITRRFSFELWTGLAGMECSDDGEEASGYLLLPYCTAGTLGDFAVTGESAITAKITGSRTKGGNDWGTGPFDVFIDGDDKESALPTALDSMDHLLIAMANLAPPPVAETATVIGG